MTRSTRFRSLAVVAAAAVLLVLAAVAARLVGAKPRPAEPEAAATGQHEGHAGPAPQATDQHQGHGAAARAPPGYAPVAVDPAALPALAVSVATVEERELVRLLRTVGTVALDETRTVHVHSKVRGWVDAISASFVGQQVEAGELLCTLYSQEVYAAELELLATPPGPLLEAVRRRLALWDVPASEIARLERTRQARRSFPLLAPRGGTVVAKNALQGMYVDASVELYTLSDLGHVWVLADVYEGDLAGVRPGIRASLLVAGLDAPIVTEAIFLAPTLDEATRTRKVRFELPNPNRSLLPGGFVSVELQVPLGRGLAVPQSAVIRTGRRSVVFVAHGDPPAHFVPREVTVGALAGEHYRVDSGLEAGERVATGAQFLIDSESRLRASSAEGGGHVHSH